MRLNLISPYITKEYSGEFPTPKEFLENSPKLKFSADTIKELRGMGKKDGVFIYMPLGTSYHGLLKEAIESHVGKEKVKIGIINGTTTKENKIKIAEQFRKGEIDVLIGGSNTSEGINLQDNGYITINTLLGRNPTERTQLNGRIWRQGNLRNEVLEVLPLLKDSGDIVMFQKAEEKSSRINDIWSFQGEAFDLEEINPMEEKLALFTNPNRKAKVEIKIEERKIDKKLNSIGQEVEFYDRIIGKMRTEELESLEEQLKIYQSEGYSENSYVIKRTRDSIKEISKDIKWAKEKLERTKYSNVEELKEVIETLNTRIKELEEEKSNLGKTEDGRTKKFEEEKNKNDKLEKSYGDYMEDLKKDFERLEHYQDRATQKTKLKENKNLLVGFMNKKSLA